MLLELKDISKSFGSSFLFANVSARVDACDKIGLVGINGSGKSTLLKIIAGDMTADAGNIHTKKNLTIGYLTQNLGLDDNSTVYEEALKVFDGVIKMEAELERRRIQLENTSDLEQLEKLNSEYLMLMECFEQNRGLYYKSLALSALEGLGFSKEQFSERISHLSGGQKMRVALVKLITSKYDLIMLDEPTNYLDVQSVQWLENFLSSYTGAYIVVSHDRYFLEKVTNRIWEIDGSMHCYSGNYSSYVKQRDEALYAQQRAYKIQSDYIRKQREVIRKLKSFNREKTVRRAESRQKMLDKLELIEKPSANKTAAIRFDTKKAVSKNALDICGLSVGYNRNALIADINMRVKAGEKIGVCGRNATGKTSLLKTLCGALVPVCGEYVWGAGSKISYFKQQHEDMDPDASILDELCAVSGEDTLKVRSVLGALLFSEDEVYKKISSLSGGEISRVAVARLMLSKSNVLLLDEPTNHLDIASKEILEEAIRGFEGTVIAVSHDRYFLNTVCERIMYINDGKCTVYDCSYDQAAAHFSSVKEQKQLMQKNKSTGSVKNAGLSKNMLKRLKNRIIAIEEEIKSTEKEKLQLEEILNSKELYKDAHKACELTTRHEELIQKINDLENEWLQVTCELEKEE